MIISKVSPRTSQNNFQKKRKRKKKNKKNPTPQKTPKNRSKSLPILSNCKDHFYSKMVLRFTGFRARRPV